MLCVRISSGRLHHHSPRLRRQFINSMQGAAGVSEEGAMLEVRASPPPAPQNRNDPSHYLLEINLPSRFTQSQESPLKCFPLTMRSDLLLLKVPQVSLSLDRNMVFLKLNRELMEVSHSFGTRAGSGRGGRRLRLGEEEWGERRQGRGVCGYSGKR